MDWKLAMEVERAGLERLAVLLFAIADLAERAGGRSPLVRGFVLWVLFPAETMARNLLTGSPAPVPDCPAGKSPEDAVRLALSLRALADAFRDLSRWALRLAPGTHRRSNLCHDLAGNELDAAGAGTDAARHLMSTTGFSLPIRS